MGVAESIAGASAGVGAYSAYSQHKAEKKARREGRVQRAENARQIEEARQENLAFQENTLREKKKGAAGTSRSLRAARSSSIFGATDTTNAPLKTSLGG